jgi:branched-chain amino acid transport system ATP-binding protein
MSGTGPILLATEGLTKSFYGVVALRDQAIELRRGEIVGVIGPNGSGKSTLFNLVTGFASPTLGSIRFKGQSLNGLSSTAVARLGIARTFQGSRLFGSLSVRDNVLVGTQRRFAVGPIASLLRGASYRRHVGEAELIAGQLLERLGLSNQADRTAADLAYGDQRRLEIARALAGGPELLLLDEPAAGMDSHETRELAQLIRQIRDDFAVAVMVIEHDMDLIMGVCERIQVLATGQVIASGSPDVVRNDPAVREAYFGHA